MAVMAQTPLDGGMTLQSKTNEATICLGRLQDISQPRGCLQFVASGASLNRRSQTKCVHSTAKPPDITQSYLDGHANHQRRCQCEWLAAVKDGTGYAPCIPTLRLVPTTLRL